MVLISVVNRVQKSFCSLEDKSPGNHHILSVLGIHPHVETMVMCYPFCASVSHTYGFYGSPQSLMHRGPPAMYASWLVDSVFSPHFCQPCFGELGLGPTLSTLISESIS